ncbi:MAG TPA: GNAT family N-acetyltransferase [Phototrophicaceae bacterium]|nr:GNAT family N-acetyltransferase [Phototrophicaceae bacterium]
MSELHDQLILRPVRPDERDALLALYNPHLHSHDDPLPPEDQVEAVWQAIIQNPIITCLVAEYQGQLIASCTLTIMPNLTHGARPYAMLETVVTHSDYRNQGIGQRLLKHALNMAWEQHCYKVMLMTGRKDEAIIHFYESVGFKRDVKTGYHATPPENH